MQIGTAFDQFVYHLWILNFHIFNLKLLNNKQLKMLSNRVDMLRYGLEVSVFNAPNKLFVIGHLKSVSRRLSTFVWL